LRGITTSMVWIARIALPRCDQPHCVEGKPSSQADWRLIIQCGGRAERNPPSAFSIRPQYSLSGSKNAVSREETGSIQGGQSTEEAHQVLCSPVVTKCNRSAKPPNRMENYLLPQPGTVRDETKMKVITKQSSRVTERTESARGSTRRLPHSTPTRVAAVGSNKNGHIK
jgi:hypothetical protein